MKIVLFVTSQAIVVVHVSQFSSCWTGSTAATDAAMFSPVLLVSFCTSSNWSTLGTLNLFKHMVQLINKQRACGPQAVAYPLDNFSNVTTVAHSQSINENN